MESILRDASRCLRNAILAAADAESSTSIAYWLLLGLFTAAYLWSEHKPPPASSAKRFCFRLPYLFAGAAALFLGRADRELFIFLAELLVAWVIYREFEASRRERSIAAIDSPALVATRARIYHEFSKFMATRMNPIARSDSASTSPPGADPLAHVVCAEDVAEFAKHLATKEQLWKRAESVIRSFERASFIGLDWLPAEWFPHGATLCGILLEDYVKNRQRDRGKEWGKRFLLVVQRAASKQKDWEQPVVMKEIPFNFNDAKKRLAEGK